MKIVNSYLRVMALVIIALVCSFAAGAQTNVITYQGQLNDGAAVANGTYQMQFSLFDAVTNGTQIGATITNTNVTVTKGIFTVQLDFSPATPFATGASRFLQIAVKKPAETNYTALDPRQPITSAPYAIRTLSATTAQTADALSSNCVSCVTNGQIAAVDGSKVTGGAAITDLNASNLTSGKVPIARLGTNTPTATTFLRGDNTFAPIPSGSGVTLQVSATNTVAQIITPLFGQSTTQNVSFNNIITAPTAGTFDGTTFTATSAGTYLVTVAVAPIDNETRGTLIQLAVNGTTVVHGTYDSSTGAIVPMSKANSIVSFIVALNTNDTVLLRGQSFSTQTASSLSTNGTTRLAIVKLN